jgi:hypothetical protein
MLAAWLSNLKDGKCLVKSAENTCFSVHFFKLFAQDQSNTQDYITEKRGINGGSVVAKPTAPRMSESSSTKL